MSVTLKKINQTPLKGHQESQLIVQFKGPGVNPSLVNAIRRVACDEVPTYAFPIGMIDIEENTSTAFNNDYMRARISLLPVPEPVKIDHLHPKYYDPIDFHIRKKRPEIHKEERDVRMYINYHNNSDTIKNVTTNDVVFKVDGEDVKYYDSKNPVLIIKLLPNQSFKCTAKAVLGIGYTSGIWRAARYAVHSYIEEDDITLTIESHRKFKETVILEKACKCLIKKLELVEPVLYNAIETSESKKNYFITIVGESHTLGELINYELQSSKDIIFSACVKQDNLVEEIAIKFSVKEDKNSKTVVEKALTDLKSKLKNLSVSFKTL